MTDRSDRSELIWVLCWAILIVVLSSLPYLWGCAIAPPGYRFLGLTHNIDDGAVYLSWMRQAADGHFFIRNLFTSEPQAARQFNVLFLLMGWFAAITRLPLIWVFHLARAALGIALIFGIWQFSKLFLDDARARRLLIPLVGLSGGLGWLLPKLGAPAGPVDTWQPEAITFLSIYLNPLFLAGLLLMLGSFYFLVLAERTGRARYGACAGLCILLLGNVHSYDVITVAGVWALYVIARMIVERRFLGRLLGLSVLAAATAVPSLAYQFYVYSLDAVFRARANTVIASPPIWSFFAGYGLVLIGAIAGAICSARTDPDPRRSALSVRHLLIYVWAVLGFTLPYIPIAQQRKLIMGVHIPLCILCAYGLVALVAHARRSATAEAGFWTSGWDKRGMALRILFVSLLFWTAVLMSPLRFMLNDMRLLNQGRTVTHYAPYISDSELAAMKWLRGHARPREVVLAPPTFALFTPAFAGVTVWYGHWSETPDYASKLGWWLSLTGLRLGYDEAVASVRDTDATYYVSTGEFGLAADVLAASVVMPPVFRSEAVRVYKLKQVFP